MDTLEDLAAALGCTMSTVDDDEDGLVASKPATTTGCPPSPGGVESTPGDEWFPEAEKARKETAVYLGLEEEEAPAPAPRSRLPLVLALLVTVVAMVAGAYMRPAALELPTKQPRVQPSAGRKPLSSR